MYRGEELTLQAMKKEFEQLSILTDKAKFESDEAANIGTEFIAIHKEFSEIVKSGVAGDGTIKKLDSLKKGQCEQTIFGRRIWLSCSIKNSKLDRIEMLWVQKYRG